MTTVFGEQEVPIATLVCGDDFAQRMERASVRAMAESIAKVGLIHPPLVRARDGSVGPGEDRIAAAIMLGWETITVRVVDCTDEELEAMRAEENAVRRVESGAELALMVEAAVQSAARPVAPELLAALGNVESELADTLEEPARWEPTKREAAERAMRLATEPDDAGEFSGGRPKSRKGRAIDQVANETGRTPEAVRKAVEREEKRRQQGSIETWGREQPAEWLAKVAEQRITLTDASFKLKTAASALSRAMASGIDVSGQREALRDTARAIRAARPACVCAWCKNLADLVAACTACKGRGWISEALAEQIPAVLRDPRQVMVQGYQYTVEPAPEAEREAPAFSDDVPFGSYGPEGGADHGEMGRSEAPFVDVIEAVYDDPAACLVEPAEELAVLGAIDAEDIGL